MLKQVLLCTALITAGTTATVRAQQSDHRPTIDYTLVFTGAESRDGAVDPAVLVAITAWLTESFELPATDHPRVELADALPGEPHPVQRARVAARGRR